MHHHEQIVLEMKVFMILLEKKNIASGLMKANDPNNLIGRLELLIIETKDGNAIALDALYDEKLNISEQLSSMNIIS